MKNSRNTALFCISAAIGSAVFAACSSDIPQSPGQSDNVEDTPGPDSILVPNDGTFRLTLLASAKNKGPRVSIDEGSVENSQNVIRWDAGDEIMVWTGNGPENLTPCRFHTEKGGNTSATFTATTDQPVESTFYLGYYPYHSTLSLEQSVPVMVPTDGSIVQTKADDSHHLSPYRPMYTLPVTRAESDTVLTGLQFRQLTSLFVFHIMNGSGKTAEMKSVTVKADKPVFHPEGLFHIPLHANEDESPQVIPTVSTSHTALTFQGETFSVSDKGNVSGYLPILPSADLDGVSLSVELESGGKTFESLQIDGTQVGQFRQGYFYVFNLRLNPDNTLALDPILEEWEKGDVTELPSS